LVTRPILGVINWCVDCSRTKNCKSVWPKNQKLHAMFGGQAHTMRTPPPHCSASKPQM
jgi:hypothetical protein